MNFEPQCKTRADLHDHMARVLRMCEAAGFGRPWECVKVRGKHKPNIPVFDSDVDEYEFALAIVEGRPVFRGSIIYIDGEILHVVSEIQLRDLSMARCSLTPPQRTIEINGVKVKAPDDIMDEVMHNEDKGYFFFSVRFKTEADAEAFKAALEGVK